MTRVQFIKSRGWKRHWSGWWVAPEDDPERSSVRLWTLTNAFERERLRVALTDSE